MGNNKSLILFLLITIIMNINEYLSSFLPCGIKQLNNFIYLDRMEKFTIQNFSEKCSFSMGPNCYFTENKNIIHYEKENNQINKDSQISSEFLDFKNEWINLYDKTKSSNFYQVYEELDTYIKGYKNYILPKNDSQQILPSLNLYLSLTFESYDDKVIKGDIYASQSKSIRFYTENIILEILGKLRLHYGDDLKLKNPMSYPSKTFGIIESSTLGIRFGGKKFKCEYFFLRKRYDNIIKINIEGYLGKAQIFSIQKEIGYMDNKKWYMISLPQKEIDRLSLPGGIEVDNFSFIIETKKQYDITVQFHSNDNQRIENLVQNSDIY